MDNRKFESGASATPPSAPSSPSVGYPTNGVPGSTAATQPGEYWFHQIGEELRNLLVAAGIAPSNSDLTQIKQALDLLYQAKGSGGGFRIQPIGASVGSNALTLTLNSTALDFRSNALTSGVTNSRTVGSAISLVVPSGATLGTVSGQAARLALLAIDNAGTVELAVSNMAGGINLDETTLIGTTAISAAANSAGTIYSTTARSNVPFRVVGFIDITETTAGTWATAPTTIQGQGGQAMAAMQSIGYSQTWQNVAASRAFGTTYYNTTGRPIYVAVTPLGSGQTLSATVNGLVVAKVYSSTNSTDLPFFLIVPPGGSYLITIISGSPTIDAWAELR